MLKRSKKEHFKKHLLLDRIPLVMEQMQGVHSVSLGIWVKVGSRHEPQNLSGISHFLEHTLFKGTHNRTYKEIAIEIDSLGGELNAFTSKELTSFYIRMPDAFVFEGLDVLMDLFLNPSFPEEEIEKEKLVVLEEIKSAEDTPDDLVHDLYSETVWQDNGLGRRILGSPETVLSFDKNNLTQYKNSFYTPPNLVISCAGDFDETALIERLETYLKDLSQRTNSAPEIDTPRFNYQVRVIEKDLQEVHIVCGTEGIAQTSEDRYVAMALNTIVGSGISSRLFQKIREEKALAYTVYSFISSYRDTGTFGVYLGTSRERLHEALETIKKELFHLRDTLEDQELDRAKRQLKGYLLMSLDSTMARMKNLAMQQIYYDTYMTPDEVIEQLQKVHLKEVKDLSDRLFGEKKLALSVVGPIRQEELQ